MNHRIFCMCYTSAQCYWMSCRHALTRGCRMYHVCPNEPDDNLTTPWRQIVIQDAKYFPSQSVHWRLFQPLYRIADERPTRWVCIMSQIYEAPTQWVWIMSQIYNRNSRYWRPYLVGFLLELALFTNGRPSHLLDNVRGTSPLQLLAICWQLRNATILARDLNKFDHPNPHFLSMMMSIISCLNKIKIYRTEFNSHSWIQLNWIQVTALACL